MDQKKGDGSCDRRGDLSFLNERPGSFIVSCMNLKIERYVSGPECFVEGRSSVR